MNLSTIPKRYLISAIIPRSLNPWANLINMTPGAKKGRNISKLKEFVTYPLQKREREEKEREKKVRTSIQNKGWCNRNSPKRAKRVQKDYHERSSQDIKLPDLSRILFKFVKFYYQYSFINCFHNIQVSLSCSYQGNWQLPWRRSIASDLDFKSRFYEVNLPFGGNASGRKGGIIFAIMHALFSNILDQQQNSQHFDNIF